MNRLKYFDKKLSEACEELNMEHPYITQDNRMGKYMACTNILVWKDTLEEFYVIKYNMKELVKARKVDILLMVFHELGHIKCGHLKQNEKAIDVCEYEAEKFAIENVEKYYPKYYQTALDTLKTWKYGKKQEYKKFYDLWLEKIKNEK